MTALDGFTESTFTFGRVFGHLSLSSVTPSLSESVAQPRASTWVFGGVPGH